MTVISLGASIKPLQLESVVLPVNRQLGTDLTLSSATSLPLTLIGKGFVSQGPVIARVDGFALTPVGPVTDRQMSVVVPASLLTSPRHFTVDVVNSTPGSVPSNVEGFSVVQSVDLTSSGCPSPSPGAVAIDDVLNEAVVTQNNCNSVAVVNLSTGLVTADHPCRRESSGHRYLSCREELLSFPIVATTPPRSSISLTPPRRPS